MKKTFCITLAAILLLVNFLPARAGDTGNQELREEIQALKAKLAEMDDMKRRLDELEKKLAANEEKSRESSESVFSSLGELKEKIESKGVKLGGAVDFNYTYAETNANQRTRGGDLAFDRFLLTADAKIDDVLLSAQYRWYSYQDVVHHAWVGYNFSKSWQGRIGITQVPFGLLPLASHNYWEGLEYYIGLADDYDLGAKAVYQNGPWNLQLAFFKNEEWGDPSKLDRYSFDVVTGEGQDNQESNQFNLRLAHTFGHGETSNTEVGLSGRLGQLYNGVTDGNGSQWAAAGHLNGNYEGLNLMLQAARYAYSPDNPEGVSDDWVQMGGGGGSFPVASAGWLYNASLAYTIPLGWGPVASVQVYDDYSLLVKDKDGWENSHVNTLGAMWTVGPVSVYTDLIFGKNAIWINDSPNPLAQGDPGAGWQYIFNVNVDYWF